MHQFSTSSRTCRGIVFLCCCLHAQRLKHQLHNVVVEALRSQPALTLCKPLCAVEQCGFALPVLLPELAPVWTEVLSLKCMTIHLLLLTWKRPTCLPGSGICDGVSQGRLPECRLPRHRKCALLAARPQALPLSAAWYTQAGSHASSWACRLSNSNEHPNKWAACVSRAVHTISTAWAPG